MLLDPEKYHNNTNEIMQASKERKNGLTAGKKNLQPVLPSAVK